MSDIIRVFPRRTSLTPTDPLAFVGDPPLWRPEADEVHVSVTWTWDVQEGYRLQEAWRQHYPMVRIGGPAFGDKPNGFVPGRYVRPGVTFTSRGCNLSCPWCLVPKREGKLTLIEEFAEGWILNDNNILACPSSHRERVWAMVRRQRPAAMLVGGLDPALVTDAVAEKLRGIRINQAFLACDTEGEERQLQRALKRLSFLGRKKLRVYMLCAFDGETIDRAEARLERVWEMGAMPFCMLYQPPAERITYSREWRALQKKWTRPAAMVAAHRGEEETV